MRYSAEPLLALFGSQSLANCTWIGLIFSPLLAGVGMTYLILGARAKQFMNDTHRGGVFALILCGAGVLMYVLLMVVLW